MNNGLLIPRIGYVLDNELGSRIEQYLSGFISAWEVYFIFRDFSQGWLALCNIVEFFFLSRFSCGIWRLSLMYGVLGYVFRLLTE